MKIISLISSLILVLIGSSILAEGTNIEQTLSDANALYEAGKYREAEKLYTAVIDESYESAALYFNLANCYYRLNTVGLAVYYYEKAKLLDPFDEDIVYNTELAELRVKNKPSVLPELTLVIFLKNSVRILSPSIWAAISIVLFLAVLIFVYFYLQSETSRQKKIRFLFSSVFLFFSLISFLFSQYHMNLLKSDDRGIVITDNLEAKSAPDENSTTVFRVYEGFKIKKESELNDWVEIQLTDGQKAWIQKEHIKFL
jgi:tetratricopeptide (TPR) repeat protein